KHAEIALRRRVGLFRRLAQPLGRLAELLRHALAHPVADAEITLRDGIVLVDALAVLIADAEIALRLRIALLCGGAHRFKRVPRFAVGGHYFSKPQKHNDRAADFKPRK